MNEMKNNEKLTTSHNSRLKPQVSRLAQRGELLMMATEKKDASLAHQPVKLTKMEKQQSKSIKKAYVRFDDYLDLNEENMRRSCKRLMNHLYSDSQCASNSTLISTMAPTISCQSLPVKCPPTGELSKSCAATTIGSKSSLPPLPLRPHLQHQLYLQQSASQQQQQPPASSSGGGKSYLRCQYERRQLRQMELMNKIQQGEKSNMHAGATGAKDCRLQQQQQDLVAKSHELSKRRFFEKLERRETIKNQVEAIGQLICKQQQEGAQMLANQIANNDKNLKMVNKQKDLDENDSNDKLLLKVYQSIAIKDRQENVREDERDTLDELDGAGQVSSSIHGGCFEQLPSELIGFCTPSPPLAASKQEKLIEFGDEQELSNQVNLAKDNNMKANDEFSYEIKVPAKIESSPNQLNEFISSGLLVVKQLEEPVVLEKSSSTATTTDRPPTLNGRQTSRRGSIVELSNKIEIPLVDFIESTALKGRSEQIKVEGITAGNETMTFVGEVTGFVGKSAPSSSPSSGGSDNLRQEQLMAACVGPTISTYSNKMKTISSLDPLEKETTVEHEESCRVAAVGGLAAPTNKQPTIDDEPSNIKGSKSPEMKPPLVEQSGEVGARASESNLAFPVGGTESTARMQQQQVASLQTTITKSVIRDVLPEANGLECGEEAIVSGCCGKEAMEQKVIEVCEEQVNEVGVKILTRGTHREEYANFGIDGDRIAKNNVKHDVGELKSINSACEDIDSHDVEENSNRLIEPYTMRSNLTRKHSSTSGEEDGGSSCSSSGFGASVSVTSNSDGSSSVNDPLTVLENSKREPVDIKRQSGCLTNLTNVCESSGHDDGYPIYDKVRCSNDWSKRLADNDLSLHYERLVRPDEPYPRSRSLLIENQNYSTIVNRCSILDRNSVNSVSEQMNADSMGHSGYANLERGIKVVPVEYATVKLGGGQICSTKQTKSLSESSLSDQSNSTNSAKSGGFSTLPPVPVNCPSANNLKSIVSLTEDPQNQRKSSLLKRFGSLVSKAFTGAAGHSVTSKNITESSEDCRLQQSVNTNEKPTKSVLTIDGNDQIDKQRGVGEADLVILPTKHVNQQRQQHRQEQQRNLPMHRHDDRLSRSRNHSRKMKQKIESSSNLSTSSSSSVSSETIGKNGRFLSAKRRIDRSKRSNSLSEDLESLMGRSGINNSTCDRNETPLDVAGPSTRRKSFANKRIEIDCISPMDNAEKYSPSSGSSKKNSSNTRSLLRFFNSPHAECVAESTPNLNNSSPQRAHRLSNHYGVTSTNNNNNEDNFVADTQQPISGFWGFSSLIGRGHATEANPKYDRSLVDGKSQVKGKKHDANERDNRDSSIYSNLLPCADGYRLQLTLTSSQEKLNKYHSLNLYQNFIQNCAERRRRRHSRHHHHYHHHHHRLRHTHNTAKCTQERGYYSTSSGSLIKGGDENNDKVTVWGQLIKINKSDGSQVIELQRLPGKSWGFFVARGAIDNVRGIFISRMHDNLTSDSLTGLLSIGDRILAIDDCPIEPDYDILRVNQMISKKSKILLKVKPFKG